VEVVPDALIGHVVDPEEIPSVVPDFCGILGVIRIFPLVKKL
jgi:hypothetical protein